MTVADYNLYTGDPPGGRAPLPGNLAYTPDYQALLQQDPGFMALQQQLAAQETTNAAQRQAATEQALVQFGDIPDFGRVAAQLGLSPEALQMLQHDIDPNAAGLAHANTQAGLSTEAQLQQGEQHAVMALRNALAARGALGSGDDAYRTGLQEQSYGVAQHDALSQLLGAIGGYQQQYLTAKQQADAQRQAGLEAALQFEQGLPQNQGFQLHYDAKHGVYRDASGNTYKITENRDGTWTLNGAGGTYTLGRDGKLTAAPPAPPAPPPVPQPPVGAPSPPAQIPTDTGYGAGGHVPAAPNFSHFDTGPVPGVGQFNTGTPAVLHPPPPTTISQFNTGPPPPMGQFNTGPLPHFGGFHPAPLPTPAI